MIRNSRLASLFCLAATLFVSLIATNAVGAQDADRTDVVGDAAVTPIAVPFVGSFEVWCTSGNPAPGTLCQNHHSTPAIDFGMDPGTPINATGDGVVIEIETNCVGTGFCRGGAGNFIAILHSDGRFSRYLHLTDVFVEEGAAVEVGDVIGTTGITGQTSSPHLHYDEQFPRGTRVQMETWIACVDGEQVLYPDSLGLTAWEDVPFGTVIRNDDYSCLANPGLAGSPAPQLPAGVQPIVASGEGIVGITAPIVEGLGDWEAVITQGTDTTVIPLTTDAFSIVEVEQEPVEIRLRTNGSGELSVPVFYESTSTGDPTCKGLHATSGPVGTPGPDVIIGTDGDDLIDSGNGDDFVCAGDGDDTVFSGSGADFVDGGRGKDDITSGKGNDTVRGGPGADTIRGGKGNDVLRGNSGADKILGAKGKDDIGGGVGDDFLKGDNGDDVIRGGKGDDTLLGNRDDDQLIGGGGTDTFDGGVGTDACEVQAADNTVPLRCET